AASPVLFLQDLWSSLLFTFSRWWSGAKEGMVEKWWWVLLVPLGIILTRRLRADRKIRRVQADTKKNNGQNLFKESSFMLIEQRLNELGFVRNPWEPPRRWVYRMQTTASPNFFSDTLLSCLHLYYQEKFSKKGLTAAQQEQLQKEIDTLLEELQEGF
ncbi:MAG: hypothetical protein D3908_15500, partial [Candidatus Electrothrix sp. AUS4]|nr:hypothetical protein [Candidatus Electrothrix sp. AUS4]